MKIYVVIVLETWKAISTKKNYSLKQNPLLQSCFKKDESRKGDSRKLKENKIKKKRKGEERKVLGDIVKHDRIFIALGLKLIGVIISNTRKNYSAEKHFGADGICFKRVLNSQVL